MSAFMFNLLKIFGYRRKTGTISISSSGETEIILGYFSPIKLKVYFSDDPCPVPCNHHHDEAKYSVYKNKEGQFILKLTWNVSDIRMISWFCWC